MHYILVNFITAGITQTNIQDVKWVSGLKMATNTFWAPGQPEGNPFEMVVSTPEGWHDWDPNSPVAFVCEHRNCKLYYTSVCYSLSFLPLEIFVRFFIDKGSRYSQLCCVFH